MILNKVHQRWMGSEESFIVEIGADLKSDALGHSTHTIRKINSKIIRNLLGILKNCGILHKENLDEFMEINYLNRCFSKRVSFLNVCNVTQLCACIQNVVQNP